MKNHASFGKKSRVCSCSCIKLSCSEKPLRGLIAFFYRYLVYWSNSFSLQLCYFIFASFLGFLVLKALKPKTELFRPKDLDMFFMSVSAATVTSMSTVEMEVFSNTQLVVLTILMFVGGEVFTSMVGLQLMKFKFNRKQNSNTDGKVDTPIPFNEIESGMKPVLDSNKDDLNHRVVGSEIEEEASEDLKYNSIRYLGYVVLGYLLVVIIGGSALVSIYMRFVQSANDVLKKKGIQMQTFSVFTIVSTFTNCGFIPTNENMIVFKKNSGLLLLLIPQILLGNTLFPSCLRLVIWFLGRHTKMVEFKYMLKYTRDMGYKDFLPSLHSILLVVTVFGFILVQFILFCSMEWNSGALDGLNSYQKAVGALFQTINSRHTGETIVDLSIISPAVLVLFVLMMYLPPYTSFLPIKDDGESLRSCEKKKRRRGWLVDNLIFSHLTYLVLFIILICITERKKMKDDPLNFTALNIVIEVISAYGNVGFTTGYSCKRQLNPNGYCKDTWYGFSGRWSNEGKLILIFVMFYGRLKKFNMRGGRAWKIS